ncbi:MAG: L-2-hydroxyglutarate oxidase [Actinomycetota bacterium]|nr:L-2-hydroxyglutarate oxidase [Actinomycetota bacterium]
MVTESIGIVGGGILGLATADALLHKAPSLRVTVLEKEAAVATHQSGRNSNVVHAGIYYTPGSLKARLCVSGVVRLRAYCRERGLAYDECGKLIVATDPSELPRLQGLLERGTGNGVPDLRWLEGPQLLEVEPHVAGVAALHSPHTAIVDYRQVAEQLARDVEQQGGAIRTSAAVTAIQEHAGTVHVTTTAGDFAFDRLVTCAGLQADTVAALSGDPKEPMIVPFRGEYLALRPDRTHLVKGMIYPVPDPRYPFLGVHLTRQVDGSVLVGPNAVMAFAREGYAFTDFAPGELWATVRYSGFRHLARAHWRTGLDEMRRSLSHRQFVAAAQRYLPALRPSDVVKGRAGIRAQAVGPAGEMVDDFHITHRGRVVNMRNAPSPAATSSLSIGDAVSDTVLQAAG